MNFKGKILWRGDVGYEEARTGRIFNKRVPERYPAGIFFPEDEADVVAAVRFANAHDYKIALRAGGHSWAAWSVRESGILLDLKFLNKINYNPETQIVAAGPATKGGAELNPYLKESGRFFNGGHCPTVGIGGFLLQGGQGWNARGWGWSCEQVVAIDVVTAAGELVRCDDTQNRDLYWAARGAGPGFFGVVTCFYLKTKHRPPLLTATTLIFEAGIGDSVLRWLWEIHGTTHPDIEIIASGQVFEFGPGVVVHALSFAETESAAREALAPFENCPYIEQAVVRKIGVPTSLEAELAVQEKINPENHRWAVNNVWLEGEAGDVVSRSAQAFFNLPTAKSFTLWFSMLPLRPLPDMAFSLQTGMYMAIYTIWEDEKDDERCKSWLLGAMDNLLPVTAGQYLGDSDLSVLPRKFMSDEHFRKLQEIRSRRDPQGRFHSHLVENEAFLNQNIQVGNSPE